MEIVYYMDKNKLCLIITGCINPNINVPVLSVKDGKQRRKQYIKSIEFYIKKANFKYIVFCDNSNAHEEDGLKELAQKYGKHFEWISFVGNSDKVVSKGKGYGEIEIINYAVANSVLIRKCKMLFKVTGRLEVKNINWFIRLGKEDNDYFLLRAKKNEFVDTRCYCIRKVNYINYFSKAGEYVDDRNGVFLEHVFYKVIQNNKIEYKLFPIEPEFSGISGSTGCSYDAPHYKNVIKSIIAYIRHR